MTLGILKVAAVLEQAGLEVQMLDLSGVENYEEVVRDYVKTSSVTCFGVTATTPQMPAATKVYRVIRSLEPSARIILVGRDNSRDAGFGSSRSSRTISMRR